MQIRLSGPKAAMVFSRYIQLGYRNQSNMDHIPDAESVRKAYELELLDSTGQKVKFGTLIGDTGRTVVVFIRHFFCGSCQAYVSQLAQIKGDALEIAHVRLVVIGCGNYQPIKEYEQKTGYKKAIYTDATRALFKHFGLIESLEVTPSDQPMKSYLAGRSRLANTLSSIWNGPLQHPHHIGKQGKFSQLGGDFIFGPDSHCSFAYRMHHTEDHTEIAELMKHAGVQLTT
ncbi:hypothetical protein BC835DRAFT_1312193 [Cytidiella melzeri]|nr:hypothetical protein BC835DRAFT_1312193 [Cytidiella melzeri]